MKNVNYHGASEMLDSFLPSNDWIPEGDLIADSEDPELGSLGNYERMLGSAVMRGEIDAAEAYRALGDYKDWVAAGEPKEMEHGKSS